MSVKPGYWMGPEEQQEKLRKPAGGNKLACSVILAANIKAEEEEDADKPLDTKKVAGRGAALGTSYRRSGFRRSCFPS